MKILRGPYLDDLLDQPAALEDTIGALVSSVASLAGAAPRAARYQRTVLTGMGASLFALQPLQLHLVARGHTALLVDTAELLGGLASLLRPGTLVVAVSQSGQSAEIVRLAESPGRRSFELVGVTNSPASPLAARSDVVVPLRAGVETSVSCKTYVATLAALTLLGDLLCDGAPGPRTALLASAPSLVRGYLARWEEHVAALGPLLDGVVDLFFAGRGASLAAALTAGLILKESTRRHAEGMTSAALRHGPIEMMSDRVFALVHEGSATGSGAQLNRRLVEDLRRAGARAHLCGEGDAVLPSLRLPAAPDVLRPLVEILPAQLISIALAALAGVEAGRFLHTAKITATE